MALGTNVFSNLTAQIRGLAQLSIIAAGVGLTIVIFNVLPETGTEISI